MLPSYLKTATTASTLKGWKVGPQHWIMTYQWHVLVLPLVFVTGIQTEYAVVKKVCNLDGPKECYTLYDASSTPLNWLEARQLCRSFNQSLTIVPDAEVQRYVTQLIQNGADIRAWIAGQVYDSGGSWHTLDRSLYYSDIELRAEDGNNCAYLHVTDSLTEIGAALCTDFKNPLCYYLSGTNCSEGFVHFGRVCLRKLTDAVSWYSAESACNKYGAQLLNYESSFPEMDFSQLGAGTMWLNVYRYPWQWIADEGLSQTVKYFNWNTYWGRNDLGQCMYVSEERAEWRSQSCDQPLDFAICSSDNGIVGQSQSTNSTTEDHNIDTNDVLAISMSCLVFVLLVIVLTLFFLLRKKRSRSARTHPPAAEADRVDAERTINTRDEEQPSREGSSEVMESAPRQQNQLQSTSAACWPEEGASGQNGHYEALEVDIGRTELASRDQHQQRQRQQQQQQRQQPAAVSSTDDATAGPGPNIESTDYEKLHVYENTTATRNHYEPLPR